MKAYHDKEAGGGRAKVNKITRLIEEGISKMGPMPAWSKMHEMFCKIQALHEQEIIMCLEDQHVREFFFHHISRTTNRGKFTNCVIHRRKNKASISMSTVKNEMALIKELTTTEEQDKALKGYRYRVTFRNAVFNELKYKVEEARKCCFYDPEKTKILERIYQKITDIRSQRQKTIMFIAEHNYKILVKPTYKYTCYTTQKSDMFQDLFLSLVDAIEQFEPDMGFKFSTYAYSKITGGLADHIKGAQDFKKPYNKTREIKDAQDKLGRGEDIGDSNKLKYTNESVRDGYRYHAKQLEVSSDPLDLLIQEEQSEILEGIIKGLDSDEQNIYRMRFNSGKQGHTYKEISKRSVSPITPEGVRIKCIKITKKITKSVKKYA